MTPRLRLLPLLIWALLAPMAAALANAASPAAPPAGAPVISVLTFSPGEIYWQRFGHNALLVREQGRAVVYNYGIFDFQQEDFLLNFARGRMQYLLAQEPFAQTLALYRHEGRAVVEQQLDLTPEQAIALRDFLVINALPENAEYRYDYFLSNCSTKLRDAIDLALDGQLRAQLLDADGNPVQGKELVFSIRGTERCRGTTGADGFASCRPGSGGGTLQLLGAPAVDILNVTNATAVILSQPSTMQLATGQSAEFEIEITATAAIGQQAAVELQIVSNDTTFPTFTVTLEGTIIPPTARIEVVGLTGEVIPAFTGMEQVPFMLPINRNRELVYTIRNAGSAPLTLTGTPFVQFQSTSGLASPPLVTVAPSTLIGVQQETTFTVRIHPNSQGFAFGVVIPNSDPDIVRRDYSFLVQGSAGQLPIASPEQTSYDFGVAKAREDKNRRTVVVYNLGPGELRITGLTLHDPSLAWRFVSSNPPLPIYGSAIIVDPQGGELDRLELVLEFAPQASSPTPLTATMTLESNDPESPEVVITLTGTAAAQSIASGKGGGCSAGLSANSGLPLALGLLALAAACLRRRRHGVVLHA